jgi:hypothetical protein
VSEETRWIFDLDKHKNETSKDAIDWVESQFPEEHYGKDILIYEAWSFRALLQQAYMAGKESSNTEELRYITSNIIKNIERIGPIDCPNCRRYDLLLKEALHKIEKLK